MTEPSSAPIQPDPEWIVGKYALMNVRASSRLGRTEIDPLCWRIPSVEGSTTRITTTKPLHASSTGGRLLEKAMFALSRRGWSRHPRPLHPPRREQVLQVPAAPISRGFVDLHVADALLEFCRQRPSPAAGCPAQRSCWSPRPALRHRHGLGRRVHYATARASASTTRVPSSAIAIARGCARSLPP